MTGGVVYVRHQPEVGLTKEAIERRIAKGAKVSVTKLNDNGKNDVNELLSKYADLLANDGQTEEADQLRKLLANLENHFLQIVPVKEQSYPSVSTE
jgi:glutamate synthase (NADPH/NADH) large chain